MDLKEQDAVGSPEDHWYYAAKARMMAAHVRPCESVLDVGAGSGFFSRWLLRERLARSAVCVDPGYEEDRDESEAGRPIAFRRSIRSSDADLVLMMDVLEHVEQDVGLLRSYLELTRPGTPVLITVPAFNALWSAHDDFLGHRRRYTLSSLRRTVTAAGASETSGHYYFGAILPAAAAVRAMRRNQAADRSDMRPVGRLLNAVLATVCSAERRVMRWNGLGGLTVVMSCRR